VHRAAGARPLVGTGPVSRELVRSQVGRNRLDRGDGAESCLPHGELLRPLRSCGFGVEDLIEIQAPEPAKRDYPEVAAAWARRWPGAGGWIGGR
jgi:hypothetical protein